MTTATSEPTRHGWIPDDASFGARIALVRQRMGWSNIKEAALACGVPPQSWRGWERDNRAPRDFPDVCRRIAAASGCDIWWLAGFELPRQDSNLEPFGYTSGTVVELERAA